MAEKENDSEQSLEASEEPGDTDPKDTTATKIATKQTYKEFKEKAEEYNKLIEQSSKYRRRNSLHRKHATTDGSDLIRVDALRPVVRAPARPLHRDRQGQMHDKHTYAESDEPTITVVLETGSQGRSHRSSRVLLPSLGDKNHEDPAYSLKLTDGRLNARGRRDSKSLPNSPREMTSSRTPLTARGGNVNRISMDDATKTLVTSKSNQRPAKLTPLKHQ